MCEEMIREYIGCTSTVSELCAKYGVARRTFYQWIEKRNIKRPRYAMPRKAVYMTREEVETVLLLIADARLQGKYASIASVLEQRLLDIADALPEPRF